MGGESVGGYTTLGSEVVHQSPWLKVTKHSVIRPDGSEGQYDVCSKKRSNQVIAITPDGSVCLVHQFRYPAQVYSWEPPGGANKEDEALEETARRELQEETGLVADEYRVVGSFPVLNGLCSDLFDVVVALGIRQVGGDDAGEEGIDNMKFASPGELVEMIKRGEINNPPAVASIGIAA